MKSTVSKLGGVCVICLGVKAVWINVGVGRGWKDLVCQVGEQTLSWESMGQPLSITPCAMSSASCLAARWRHVKPSYNGVWNKFTFWLTTHISHIRSPKYFIILHYLLDKWYWMLQSLTWQTLNMPAFKCNLPIIHPILPIEFTCSCGKMPISKNYSLILEWKVTVLENVTLYFLHLYLEYNNI